MFDITIVGSGIVGLATGYNILNKYPGLRICIVEKEDRIAQHQTGNNSGVIHSGIYYKPGSLKAKNCSHGYRLLLSFLQEHDIKYELCGKIIVATNESELGSLTDIYDRGIKNGLDYLQILDSKQILDIEPHVRGIKAIHVPQAGITDYKTVAQKLRMLLEEGGVSFVFGEKVFQLGSGDGHIDVVTKRKSWKSGMVINCGGLYSDKLARLSLSSLEYKIVPFRGEYYNLKPKAYHLVKGLIYPVPDPNFPFLGVHFTRTIHGGVESGPNAVLAFSREGYSKTDVHLTELMESLTYRGFLSLAASHWKAGCLEMYRSYSKRAYVRSLQKLIPAISANDVVRGGSGVRAQAVKRDGSMVDDFLILKSDKIINVCNAPSPAATASLAIGEHIASLI